MQKIVTVILPFHHHSVICNQVDNKSHNCITTSAMPVVKVEVIKNKIQTLNLVICLITAYHILM